VQLVHLLIEDNSNLQFLQQLIKHNVDGQYNKLEPKFINLISISIFQFFLKKKNDTEITQPESGLVKLFSEISFNFPKSMAVN